MAYPLAPFANQNYISLETYKKSGQAVAVPVWFAEFQTSLYAITPSDTGKVKRIRNNAQVRIAPCDRRGKPTGAWGNAHARIVDPDETQRANQLVNHKYGWQKKIVDVISSFRKTTQAAIVITLDNDQ